jgi:uncharacterized protein (DUF2249 family)
MKISVNTKIASILKHNPASLDAIISLNRKFEKLRNPILRKLMAGRTSLAQAARIGDVSVKDFFDTLAPLGFEANEKETETSQEKRADIKPHFIQNIPPGHIHELDVRPLLSKDEDPLQLIMKTIRALPQDHVLKLINSFEPTPLIALLEKKGYVSYSEWVDGTTIHTFFHLSKGEKSDDLSSPVTTSSEEDFDRVLKNFGNNKVTINVRHLEMPQPMLTILEELQKLPVEKALFVYHKRIPVYLIDELKEKRFDFRIKQISTGEVEMLIWKEK